MKLPAALLILFVCICFTSVSQENNTEKYKEYFDEGDYFFNRKEYGEAVFYYLKLMEYQPDNANFNFKIGECYLNIPGKEAKAVPYFERAVKNVTQKKKYKQHSFDEDKAPLHAYYYLGNAYRAANRLDKALESYNTFVLSPFYVGNYNITIVENEIASCERAKIIEDNPIKVTETLLPETINTPASELDPVISGNEKSFVFVRRLKFYDAIFYSRLENNEWTKPENLNPEIGSDGDFYPTSLSFNGDELYLVKKSPGNFDIFVSRLVNGKWTEAEKLGKNINSLSNETHAAISEDGQKLFVSSDRNRGKGGFDIWVSVKDKSNQWGKLKNLGKTINTPFDEVTPFPIKDGNVLFFSSKGHYNMGGFDIFYSTNENKKWTTPVNIGSPINNTTDNTFYTPDVKGNVGYLSKFPADGGSEDIYKIVINSNMPRFQ